MLVKKRYIKTVVLFVVFCFQSQTIAFSQSIKFRDKYSGEYKLAVTFLKKNRVLIKKELSTHGINPKEILPIAFPELVRFSEMQNFVETSSLELLYVNFGKAYANFSIGRFQMKPSFIEALESQVKKYNIRVSMAITKYEALNIKEIRAIRIRRLSSFEWQLRYLKAFYLVIQVKSPKIWRTKKEKLQYFASAYNLGLNASPEAIKKWAKVSAFPRGKRSQEKQFNYSNIAWGFYSHDFDDIFKQ